ncbi:MAG: saccharopine dehydrogenase NADP-binding domain-containing protein [Acidimicrobiales bacterium]
MGSIVVLGGAGGVGRVAVEALTLIDSVDEVVVADFRAEVAQEVVDALGGHGLRAVGIDVTDRPALVELLRGADVVLNCVGPFYKFAAPTLEAAIEAGVGYVDICDDLDATRALLDLDAQARDAGITALIGMGNSPGLANIFVKLCAEDLLDEVTSAEIMHIHGGEPSEGAAVLKHRIHAMVNDVPLYVDGQFIAVRQLEESGAPYIHEEDFPDLGPYPVYPYPHPETITLPKAFPSLRKATNLGVVYPLSYFALTQDLVRVGLGGYDPMRVGDAEVAPVDMAVAILQRERPRLMAEAGITEPGGCLRVVVGGTKDGEEHRYVCSLSSKGAGAGEGTGIPAALGAALHQRGALEGGPGVHAPEAIVPVGALMDLAGQVVKRMSIGDGEGIPLVIEHIGPDGSRDEIPMALG